MTGSYSLQLSSSKIIFDITLRRNITVICGNGASYKTLFCKLIRDSKRLGSGIHLRSTANLVVLTDTNFYQGALQFYRGTESILVFDEGNSCIGTKEFREAITDTGCYFVLITRERYSNFGVSTKEIYEFQYDDTIDLNKRTVYMKPYAEPPTK